MINTLLPRPNDGLEDMEELDSDLLNREMLEADGQATTELGIDESRIHTPFMGLHPGRRLYRDGDGTVLLELDFPDQLR